MSASSIETIPETGRATQHSIMSLLLRDREGLLERIFARTQLGQIAGMLLLLTFGLLGVYGGIMGSSGVWMQGFSSAVKLPLLYLLSLLVCFPALYLINTLMGSRLGVLQTFTMMLIAFGLNGVLLAGFAPIVLFFIMTGSDYHFLKLLHVAVMTFSGFWSLGALYRAMVSMCDHSSVYPKHALGIMALWILVFGFVGTQMAWTLRPFLGAPDLSFELIRHAGSGNFYQAVWISVRSF